MSSLTITSNPTKYFYKYMKPYSKLPQQLFIKSFLDLQNVELTCLAAAAYESRCYSLFFLSVTPLMPLMHLMEKNMHIPLYFRGCMIGLKVSLGIFIPISFYFIRLTYLHLENFKKMLPNVPIRRIKPDPLPISTSALSG